MQKKIKEADKGIPIENDFYSRDINYVEVGNRIRIRREDFQMSRDELSRLLNISVYFLGQIERGDRKMSITTLINISRCLHISIDYLFFEQINGDTGNNALDSLIDKCSENEIKIIEKIIKVILPHIKR